MLPVFQEVGNVQDNSRLVVTVRQESRYPEHTIARFRLAYSAENPSIIGVNGIRLSKRFRDGCQLLPMSVLQSSKKNWKSIIVKM
jgi:hypothetical protein